MQYKVYYSQVDLGPDQINKKTPYIIVDADSTNHAETQCVRMLRHTQKWGPDTELYLDDAVIVARRFSEEFVAK